jgi:LysM repeat protein
MPASSPPPVRPPAHPTARAPVNVVYDEEEEEEEWDEEEEEEMQEDLDDGTDQADDDEHGDSEYEEEEGEGEADDEANLATYAFEYSPWKCEALQRMTITAMYASQRAIAVGTATGDILMLAADGSAELNTPSRLRKHDASICDICIDEECEYVGCVSEDGVVSIESVSGGDYFHESFSRPLRAISLHPRYKSQDDKPFVCGGKEGKLIYCSRGFFFGSRKSTTIDEKDGDIYCVRWHENCIAWATSNSIVLANAKTKKVFFRQPRTSDACRGDLYRCNMFWESETRLVVGWGNQVFQIDVTMSHFGMESSAQLFYYFRLDKPKVPLSLLGLCPYDNANPGNFMAVLSPDLNGYVPEVEVALIERTLGEPKFSDQLAISEASKRALSLSYLCIMSSNFTDDLETSSYLLAIPGGNNIRIRRVNDDDRMRFLIDAKKYHEAYQFICERPTTVTVFTKREVGRMYLSWLYRATKYKELAERLPVVLKDDPEAPSQWQGWIEKFLKDSRGHVILPYVPNKKQNALSPTVYELLLNDVLYHSVPEFKRYISSFEGLYDPRPVCNAANLRLRKVRLEQTNADKNELKVLAECVGLLYEKQGNHHEAFKSLKEIQESTELFDFIHRHHLEQDAADSLSFLYSKNREYTLALLITAAANPESDHGPLAPTQVMKRIRGNSAFQWEYYCRLAQLLDPIRAPKSAGRAVPLPLIDRVNPAKLARESEDSERQAARLMNVVVENLTDLVHLCIDNEPQEFNQFLRAFQDQVDVSDTLRVCMEHGMYEEAAFLQAKRGDFAKALEMLVVRRMSVPKAVNFIRDWADSAGPEELFATLVKTALEVDSQLEGRQGLKFYKHKTSERDTWQSLASAYDVDKQTLMSYNNVVSDAASVPQPVRIPVNLIAALLAAVADTRDVAGIDPIYLIRQLPHNCHIPNLADRLTKIAASKKSHSRLMETIIDVLNGDIHDAQVNKTRVSMAAVRVTSHRQPCSGCGELLAVTKGDVVTYRCGHMMHCHCALQALCDRGAIRLPAQLTQQLDPSAFVKSANEFFRRRGATIQPTGRFETGFPFCTECSAR